MSLVIAWSDSHRLAAHAEAVLQYALFRLELEGHTTLILAEDDLSDLLGTADAVVVLTDRPEALATDARLSGVPGTAPLLLLQAGLPRTPARPLLAGGRRSILVPVAAEDLHQTDCGADFTGATEAALRQALRRMAALLSDSHPEDISRSA